MNISTLFQTIKGRLLDAYENNKEFPTIQSKFNGNTEEINLFPSEFCGVYESIYLIAESWDDIRDFDKRKIVKFLVGSRQYLDLIVLFMWIKNRTNIDNDKLMKDIIL